MSRAEIRAHRRRGMNVPAGRKVAAVVLALAGLAASAPAQDIRIRKSGTGKIDIDLAALQVPSPSANGLKAVLRDDLVRSGWFNVVEGGAAIQVRGRCLQGGNSARIEADVLNVGTSSRYLTRQYDEPGETWRRAAHRLADDIVQAVKGVPGFASGRIALVGRPDGSRNKNLFMCDADGQGLVPITSDNSTCASPAWAPRGDVLYYMSYHKGYGDIYSIDLGSRQRARVCGYPGINATPDVSPNGQYIAVILSKDGNADVYVTNRQGGAPERVTNTKQAAEASPSWSPDGSQLVFVSDRSGSPQLYVVGRSGGTPKRLTFRGNENVAPDWGSDGRIAYISRREGRYSLCVLNPATGEDVQLTLGGADYEDPSWAPDNRHIVCSRSQSYRSALYLVDTLGDPEVRLSPMQGDWFAPAWSPR